MRVAVTGATGNVGSSVVAALAADDRVDEVLGIARHAPAEALPKVEWLAADVRRHDLVTAFRGADAVIHLAWLIQPSHRPDTLASVNVFGSERVFEAVAAAGVPVLVHASSVGVYSPGRGRAPVDETWPREGISTCSYSRDKATCEHMLDRFESRQPQVRVVRLRPSLIFKRGAGAEVTGYFLGSWIKRRMVPSRLPAVPLPRGLALQAVHTDDVAAAYVAAVFSEVRGAINVAADPVIDAIVVAREFGARVVQVPPAAMRAGMSAAWKAHLQPTDPGWFDMALGSPVMDCSRAHGELGWTPKHPGTDALHDVLAGVRDQADDLYRPSAGRP